MTRIVTTAYRYKRPPWKRKAVAIEGPAVVRKSESRDSGSADDVDIAAPSTNGDRKSAIVTTTSRKQSKLLRADKRAPTTDSDPEMRAWILRAMQGGWR